MKKREEIQMRVKKIYAYIMFLLLGFSIFVSNPVDAQAKIYKVSIPTYNQHSTGYPRGCEGVSLYMALRGKGYLKGISLKKFMNTMPKSSSNPEKGYVGDPRKSASSSVNKGKRTTINPSPLAKWGAKYGDVKSLQGSKPSKLKKELKKGNPIVVWVTGAWATPRWGRWSWGKAVTNNHAVCLVGYNSKNGKYLINDCSGGRGEYWVSKSKFEKIYNARKFAVVVR